MKKGQKEYVSLIFPTVGINLVLPSSKVTRTVLFKCLVWQKRWQNGVMWLDAPMFIIHSWCIWLVWGMQDKACDGILVPAKLVDPTITELEPTLFAWTILKTSLHMLVIILW